MPVNLTIGLPLVSRLTVAQFGGVLAHEFGHFAQGAGMRLNYIIRTFNDWISRIAFQPEIIEQKIAGGIRRGGVYGFVIALSVRTSLWLTRRLLHGLLLLSHAISCYAMRQMEHDADLYEAKIAGRQAFGGVMRNLRWLNGGAAQAMLLLQRAAGEQRCAANFVELVNRRSDAAKDYDSWSWDETAEPPTHWFDTHPSSRARIEHVSAITSVPLLTDARPAPALFVNFDELSRAITREFYATNGIPLDKFQIQELDAFCEGEVLTPSQIESVSRFFANRTGMERPFSLTAEEIALSEPERQDALDREWHNAREQTEDAFQAFLRARLRRIELMRARTMIEARIRFDRRAFRLSKRSRKEIEAELKESAAELIKLEKNLEAFDAITRRRLAAALKRSNSIVHEASYSSFLNVLQSLRRLAPRYEMIYESMVCLADLLASKRSHRPRTKAHRKMIETATSLTAHLKELRLDLEIPNPIHGGTILARIVSRWPSTKLPYEQEVFLQTRECLTCLASIYFQCLARVCTEAAQHPDRARSSTG